MRYHSTGDVPLLLFWVGKDPVGIANLGPLRGLVRAHVRVASSCSLPECRLDSFFIRTPGNTQIFVVVCFLLCVQGFKINNEAKGNFSSQQLKAK